FGSFKAPRDLFGIQTNELVPGNAFLWNLATWNQGGDDLRGVDALAIIGNAGSFFGTPNASDGVVSLSSASLGFARDTSRTRILPYCHVNSSLTVNSFLHTMDCSGGGIANIDEAPETGRLVLAFLNDTLDSVTFSTTPDQDPVLSRFGGVYFAEQTSSSDWLTDLRSVSLGAENLSEGQPGEIFYKEFLAGSGVFEAVSGSAGTLDCNPITVAAGYFQAVRCKTGPKISSVGMYSGSLPAKVVRSGGPVTIIGFGFGRDCDSCGVFISPGGDSVPISSWSDQSISVTL